MRSIVYNGVDLSEWCSAGVVEKVALPVTPETMVVPGRAGALLVSGRVPPRLVRVRLFVDAGFKPGTNGLADIRHMVYAALCSTTGGALRLPDEPEYEYRDVVCTDAGSWSSLFEDGSGEISFALLDPVAYGLARSEAGTSFEVGGTWPTWPAYELTASAGPAVQVGCDGAFVRIERIFSGGEVVRIDCETEGVTVDGIDARADVTGTAGCVLYHVNALWALRRVAEVWCGEVEPVITVAGGRVASRSIRFKQRLGSWRGLRFTYGKNMAGCTRTVLEQDVYTALYGFGAGLPVTDEDGRYTGGYRKKLTFGEVNGGVNWVGDEQARLVWGRWNANRTAKVHSFGQVTFSECDDPARLLALTRKALVEAMQPKVSYEIDVAALDGGECDLGDTVAVVDSSRTPEWRLKARVVKRVRTFGGAVICRVTIGTVQQADYAVTSSLAADVAALQDDVAGIDGNLSVATSVQVVEGTVTEAIDDLNELADLDF